MSDCCEKSADELRGPSSCVILVLILQRPRCSVRIYCDWRSPRDVNCWKQRDCPRKAALSISSVLLLFSQFLPHVQCLKGNSGVDGLVVIPHRVFLCFSPILNEIKFDAIGWLLSRARNCIFVSWLYQQHLGALHCIELSIPELS